MKEKVKQFLETVTEMVNDRVNLSKTHQKSEISNFITELEEADCEVNLQNIRQQLGVKNTNLDIIKMQIKNKYSDISQRLAEKHKSKFDKMLEVISSGRKSLFSEQQKAELKSLILNVKDAAEDKVQKAAESLKAKISDFLNVDESLKKFEASITEAWKNFDDAKHNLKEVLNPNLVAWF
jgi:hypothetical protein